MQFALNAVSWSWHFWKSKSAFYTLHKFFQKANFFCQFRPTRNWVKIRFSKTLKVTFIYTRASQVDFQNVQWMKVLDTHHKHDHKVPNFVRVAVRATEQFSESAPKDRKWCMKSKKLPGLQCTHAVLLTFSHVKWLSSYEAIFEMLLLLQLSFFKQTIFLHVSCDSPQ